MPHLHYPIFFLLRLLRPPALPLFPYPTLFRSRAASVPPRGAPPASGPPAWGGTGRGCRRRDRLHARHRHPRPVPPQAGGPLRSEEHTSELQSPDQLVCRLLLEKKKEKNDQTPA